jgi:hypothetical protein
MRTRQERHYASRTDEYDDEANATSSPANRLVAGEDAFLVTAMKGKDTRAFELLTEQHEQKFLSMAQRITRNREDAEDVLYPRASGLLWLGLAGMPSRRGVPSRTRARIRHGRIRKRPGPTP